PDRLGSYDRGKACRIPARRAVSSRERVRKAPCRKPFMPRCLLVVSCVLALSASAISAEADALALRQRLLESEAELEALRLEEKLGTTDHSLEQRRAELADAVPKLNRIADRLKTTSRARQEALNALAGEVAAERAAALKLW